MLFMIRVLLMRMLIFNKNNFFAMSSDTGSAPCRPSATNEEPPGPPARTVVVKAIAIE